MRSKEDFVRRRITELRLSKNIPNTKESGFGKSGHIYVA